MGEEAFLSGGTFIKPAVRRFLDTMLALTWNRYRKTNTREVNKLEKDLAEVTETWQSKYH